MQRQTVSFQVLAMKAKKEPPEKPKTISELLDTCAKARKEMAKFRASLRGAPKVSVKRNGDARSPLLSLILPSPKEAVARLRAKPEEDVLCAEATHPSRACIRQERDAEMDCREGVRLACIGSQALPEVRYVNHTITCLSFSVPNKSIVQLKVYFRSRTALCGRVFNFLNILECF